MMIPYHQWHKPSEFERAIRGPEPIGRKDLVLLAGWMGILVAVVLLSLPWWWK